MLFLTKRVVTLEDIPHHGSLVSLMDEPVSTGTDTLLTQNIVNKVGFALDSEQL